VKQGRGYFGPLWSFFSWLWWLPMVVQVLWGTKGSSWWQWVARKWSESHWKIACNRGENRLGWSRRGFGLIVGSLADSIYTKHELSFLDTESFRLTQKSSNLVMLWLPKNASNFTQN